MGKVIKYLYDAEGISGFIIVDSAEMILTEYLNHPKRLTPYRYVKDAMGNIVSILGANGEVARYEYDAWGKCKVLNPDGTENIDPTFIGNVNPYRFKSYYQDAESGLYYINGRWYDPERCGYISSASPEMLLQNASLVYGINLYAMTVTNPVSIIFAACTYMPSLNFYYDGEYKTAWDIWGKWVTLGLAVLAMVIAVIAAPFTCGASSAGMAIGATLLNIFLGTAIGAATAILIGGAMAGIQSALTGHSFWQAFGEYASENYDDILITSFAVTAVSVAASNIVKCFQCFKEGTLVETEEGLKPIEEIEIGDKVLAYNEETGEQAYKEVVRLFRNTTEEWYHIHVNGEEIVCTGGHPFYVLNVNEKRNLV